MEGGRIEAGGDADVALVAEDELERSRRLGEMMIDGGHQRPGADMDWQEGGLTGLGRRRSWGRVNR
jgi:hypothetical protein